MTQTWNTLLFAHWPVPVKALRRLVPARFALDLHEGVAWVGIVPFEMDNVAPRGVPALPGLSRFPELNVRTYVRVNGVPGVYFFSLDASSRLAVAVARTFFHLPYHAATMRSDVHGDTIAFVSRRRWSARRVELEARYRPDGPSVEAPPGTLAHFLTERYCLFTLDRTGRACRVDIHHAPWRLHAAEAEIAVNTMAEAADLVLPAVPPLLHFSKRQDVVAWRLIRVDQ